MYISSTFIIIVWFLITLLLLKVNNSIVKGIAEAMLTIGIGIVFIMALPFIISTIITVVAAVFIFYILFFR